jgi:lipoate-protein ligase A
MSIFAELDVYQDAAPRMAAMNMALDEALLERATRASIRFYQWDHLALSFGYFGKYIDVAEYAVQRDSVRRWTGGGIVFHGDDLTYSVIIPGNNPAFAELPRSIYERIHQAISNALAANGTRVKLAAMDRDAAPRRPRTAQRAVPTNICFANPVPTDVMLNGRKVAGAAQRRTRRGLLQQGSIQQIELAQDFVPRFADELSTNWIAKELNKPTIDRATEIADQRYVTADWLRRR